VSKDKQEWLPTRSKRSCLLDPDSHRAVKRRHEAGWVCDGTASEKGAGGDRTYPHLPKRDGT